LSGGGRVDSGTFILQPSWLIPVQPRCEALPGYSVVVEGDTISALLPHGEACRRFPEAPVHELPGRALLPGLVNAHCHSAMSLLRGLADDVALMDWLREHIWPVEQRWMGREYVTAGSELAVIEYLRGGITCFNDVYFFPDVTAGVAQRAGIRCRVGLPVIDLPTAWAQDSAECIRRGLEVYESLRDDPLVTTAFAPHAPYTVDDAAFARLARLAAELDLPIHLHLHETATEIADSEAQYGVRPLARLHGLGLLSPALIAVHMTQVGPGEAELLAEHGVHVVHCPESNLKFGNGFCPVQRLLDAGVNVALGTDGAASNNDLDLLGEMRTAALLAKGVSGDATAVDAAQALRMATINGARAMGLQDKIGSIEPGKQADFCAVDLSEPETQPLNSIVSQLVYAAGRWQVSEVWVAGRQVVSGRRVTSLDTDLIIDRVTEWRDRFHGTDGDRMPPKG